LRVGVSSVTGSPPALSITWLGMVFFVVTSLVLFVWMVLGIPYQPMPTVSLLMIIITAFLRNYDCVEHMAIYGDTKIPIGEVNIGVGQAIKSGWTYSIEGGYWFRGGVRFRHAHWTILEVFDWGIYEGVDVRGKTVIDVGAFVGDSAIYFALRVQGGLLPLSLTLGLTPRCSRTLG